MQNAAQWLSSRVYWLLFPLAAYPFSALCSRWADNQLVISPFLVAMMGVAYLGSSPQLLLSLLLCTLLSAELAEPRGSLAVASNGDAVRVVTMTLFGALNGWIIEIVKRRGHALQVHARDLMASEERYRRIVETANEGIWFQDANGGTRYANEQLVRLLRTSREELGRTPALEYVHPDDREGVAARRRRVLAGELSQGDARLIRGDQSVGWFLLRCAPMRERGEQVIGLLAMLTDITERKEHEERARHVTHLARAILWEARVTEAEDGFDWDQTYIDEAAAQRDLPVDVDPTIPYARSRYRCLPPEDRERWRETVWEALRSGQRHVTVEFRCQLASGEIRWLADSIILEPLEPGRWRAVGVTTDITASKEREQQLELALRVADLTYWSWDIVNDRIVWPEDGPRFYGVAVRTYQEFLALVHEEDRARVDQSVQESLKTGSRYRAEFRFCPPGRSEVRIRAEAEVYRDGSGNPVMMIGVSRNLTAQDEAAGPSEDSPSNRESE